MNFSGKRVQNQGKGKERRGRLGYEGKSTTRVRGRKGERKLRTKNYTKTKKNSEVISKKTEPMFQGKMSEVRSQEIIELFKLKGTSSLGGSKSSGSERGKNRELRNETANRRDFVGGLQSSSG